MSAVTRVHPSCTAWATRSRSNGSGEAIEQSAELDRSLHAEQLDELRIVSPMLRPGCGDAFGHDRRIRRVKPNGRGVPRQRPSLSLTTSTERRHGPPLTLAPPGRSRRLRIIGPRSRRSSLASVSALANDALACSRLRSPETLAGTLPLALRANRTVDDHSLRRCVLARLQACRRSTSRASRASRPPRRRRPRAPGPA